MQIEIKGKKIGLKFNKFAIEELGKMPYLKKFVDKKNKEPVNTYGYSISVIWAGYKGWCFLRQQEEEITFENISDWVDLSFNDEDINQQIAAILKYYMESDFHAAAQKKSENLTETQSQVNGLALERSH